MTRIRRVASLVALVVAVGACIAPASESNADPAFETTTYAPQNRPDVRGTIGAVSAGHPLAAQAGLEVLKDGGTAMD
ncbi:MAG: gamma-glutamyltransferase, partial [Longimicrobiales bacterium]